MADENRTYQAAIEIDTTGADKKIDALKKDIKDLKKQTDKASDSAKDLAFATKESGNQSNQFAKMASAIQEVYEGMHDTVNAFEDYVHNVSNQSDKVDDSFARTVQQIKKLEHEYQEMMNAVDMAMARSIDMPGSSSDTLQDLENLRTKIQFTYRDIVDLYEGTITQLNNMPRAGNGITAIEEIEQKSDEAKQKIEQSNNGIVDANNKTAESNNKTADSFKKLTKGCEDVQQASEKGFGQVSQDASKTAEEVSNSTTNIKDLADSIGDSLSNAYKLDAQTATQDLNLILSVIAMIRTQTQKMSEPLRAYASEAQKARDQIKLIKKELHEVQQQKAPTEEFIKLNDEIKNTERALQGIENNFNGTGLIDTSQLTKEQVSEMKEQAIEYKKQLEEMQAARQELIDSGNAFKLDVDWESVTQLRRELTGAKQDYKDLKKEANAAEKAVDAVGRVSSSTSSGIGGLVTSAIGVLSPIAGAITSIAGNIISGIGNILKSGLQMIGNILKQILNLAVSVAKSIWNALKKAVSVSLDVATNIAKMVSKPVLSGVKSLAKWIAEAGLSLSGFNIEAINGEGLIKKLTNAVDEFMGFFKRQTIRSAVRYILNDIETVLVNIAKIDDEFNETMSNLIDSAKALGAQIVAIVEPIINAIGPYLIQIMDWLTGVADAAAQFVARITGNDTYIKASKGQSDYASSLDDTTESTKKATKATQEYQNTVLAFDQLNKLDDVSSTVADEDEESIIGVSDADLKKAQTQASALNDLADDIYKAFTNKDWYKMGQGAGEALTKFFDWLDELVGWEKNWEKFSGWIQNAIDWVNGLIVGTDWVQIGKDIGDILNTIIETFKMITDPVSGIDFRGLGQGIGKMLVSAIETIKWKDLGYAIIQGMQAAVNFVVGILDEKVGKKLGEGLADCISGIADGIDPEVWSDLIVGLFDNFFDFFIELFSNPEDFAKLGYKIGAGLADAIKRIDLSKVYAAMDNFWASLTAALSNFEEGFANYYDLEDGESVWTAIGEGLMIGLQGIMQWLTENLLNGETGKAIGEGIADFLNGAISAFDPDTWANFIHGLGDLLGELLVAVFGDTDTWYEIGNKIGETIVKILNVGTDDAEDEVEKNGIGEGLHAVWQAFLAALTGIDDSQAIASISEALHNLIQTCKDALNDPTFQKELQQFKDILNDCIRQMFEIPEGTGTLEYFSDMIGDFFADVVINGLGKIPGKLVDSLWEYLWDHMSDVSIKKNAKWFATTFLGYTDEEFEKEYAEAEAMANESLPISPHYDEYNEVSGDIIATGDQLADAIYNMGYEAAQAGTETNAMIQRTFDGLSSRYSFAVDTATGIIEMTNLESGRTYELSLETFLDTYVNSAEYTANGVYDSNGELIAAVDDGNNQLITSGEEYADALQAMGVNTSQACNACGKDIGSAFDDFSSNSAMSIDMADRTVTISVAGLGEDVTMSFDEFCKEVDDGTIRIDNGMTMSLKTIDDDAREFAENKTVFDSIVNFGNKVASTFERILNTVISKITGIFNWAGDLIGSITGWWSTSDAKASTYSIPALASGGIIRDGQLFIANEQGPELIGSYGSNTGVMNNDQMVSAVTEGVRSAVVEAMNNQDSGDIVLYIDSEEIARASTKGNRSIQKRTNPVVSFA